jgi:hypothetical protein
MHFLTWKGIFLLSKVSRLVLESNKPSIQLLSEALSLGKKNPWCNTEHSPITSANVRNEYSYSFSDMGQRSYSCTHS